MFAHIFSGITGGSTRNIPVTVAQIPHFLPRSLAFLQRFKELRQPCLRCCVWKWGIAQVSMRFKWGKWPSHMVLLGEFDFILSRSLFLEMIVKKFRVTNQADSDWWYDLQSDWEFMKKHAGFDSECDQCWKLNIFQSFLKQKRDKTENTQTSHNIPITRYTAIHIPISLWGSR